jgi:diguanylate cyclase (GGDEF)-like protein
MATNLSPHIQEKFQRLQKQYQENLRSRLKTIHTLWQALFDPYTEANPNALLKELHQLAGSAGSFGFTLVGDIAHLLENDLGKIFQTPQGISIEQQLHIESLIQALEAASQEQKASVAPSSKVILSTALENTPSGKIFVWTPPSSLEREAPYEELRQLGYILESFQDPFGLEKALERETPLLLLVDMDQQPSFLQQENQPSDLSLSLSLEKPSKNFPLFYCSEQEGLTQRLKALRAQGDGFLKKPLEIQTLLKKLEPWTAKTAKTPSRILMIEDDILIADYYASLLKMAGFMVKTISDPLHTQKHLEEFHPDLLLLDLYMPGCNGLELAQIIRQQENFIHLPLLFLSSEKKTSIQIEALKLGGDDFLTKPVDPQELIAVVCAKIQRSQVLHHLMIQDSLTGLLNHGKLKSSLEVEILRATRHNDYLAFAMLDLDHFKKVNDTYGHPTGDRVLKQLSLLLQQKLRRTDRIGRYGGEEFAIIFINTDGTKALKLLEHIREEFEKIPQNSEDGEFFVTFSAGIAAFPPFKEAKELLNAADQALYQAKQQGRNRIILNTKW